MKLHIRQQTNPPRQKPAMSTHSLPRCSQPLSTNQTPHPTTKTRGDNQALPPVSHTRDKEIAGLLPQSPIVCLAVPSPASIPRLPTGSTFVVHPAGATTATRLLTAHTPLAGVFLVVLLRKEVIQPHLPVRLPCYDFVPIADPTFDSSLPMG